MNIYKHISLLTLNINKSKLVRVRQTSSDCLCDEINLTTHTCGRLLMHNVSKVALLYQLNRKGVAE